jgi:hypothetical protein
MRASERPGEAGRVFLPGRIGTRGAPSAMLIWVSWRGIRIQNWHRPLSTYMTLLLDHGLHLRLFAEPAPVGGDPETIARHRRVPYFHIMEWQKPL